MRKLFSTKLKEFLGAFALVLGISSTTAMGTYIIREDIEYLLGDHKPPVMLEVPVPVPVVENFDHTELFAVLADGSFVGIESMDKKPANTLWVLELKFNWGDGIMEETTYLQLGEGKIKGYTFRVVGCGKFVIILHDCRPKEKEGF